MVDIALRRGCKMVCEEGGAEEMQYVGKDGFGSRLFVPVNGGRT